MADAPAPPLHYFIRLVPPRPDFPFTLTQEEADAMAAHPAYWREHRAAGTVLIAGPVDDPAGAWGLGVLRVASLEALLAFEAGDPAIRAGIGMRFEHTPMLSMMAPP